MDLGDVYVSDEFDSDDIIEYDDEENACSNTNELLNKSDSVKHAQQIEDDISLNETVKRTSLLNADVPEFVPRNLEIDNTSPVINMGSSSSKPETIISSTSENMTNIAPITASVSNNNTRQSVQHHAKGCQTITRKIIDKSVQTKMKSVNANTQTLKCHICNCMEQMEIKEQRFKAKLSSMTDENKNLHKEVSQVKCAQEENEQKLAALEEYKKQLLQHQEKTLIAENIAQMASARLETDTENWQGKVNELQEKIEEQKNTIDDLRKCNQSMHLIIATQSMQYFTLQQRILTNYLNKCRKMVFDLTEARACLSTDDSIPTIAECHRHIKQWQDQLKQAEHCLELLQVCQAEVTNDIHLSNFSNISLLPELSIQLTEHNDILHDSFVLAITTLRKENLLRNQQSLQFQQQYTQWWNAYGRLNQPRPAIIAAAPRYYTPLVSASPPPVQISDVTAKNATTPNNSDLSVNPKTSPPPVQINDVTATNATTPNNSDLSVKPKTTESTALNAKSVTDTLKLSQQSNTPESCTPNVDSLMEHSVANEETYQSVGAAKECEKDNPSMLLKSNGSEDEESSGGSEIQSQEDSATFSLTRSCQTSEHSSTTHKLDDNLTAASVSHLPEATLSTISSEVPKIVDYSQLPEAVRKAGRNFCDLYLYVKERVPENTDIEVFSALKRVRRKNTKLSGFTKDAIVDAVMVELKTDGNDHRDTATSTLTPIDSEVTDLNRNYAHTKCIICMDPFKDIPVTRLSCRHIFHNKCITQWFVYKNDCPVCRVTPM